MMRKEYYLLKVLTPLHIGAGQGLGHVDLPIVREAHTNFPYIPGTSLKGALRNLEINQVVAKARGEKPSQVEERLTTKINLIRRIEDILRLAKIFGIAEGRQQRKARKLGRVKSYFQTLLLCFSLSSLQREFFL
jgi:CRISPR-associated protein Cmr4